MKIPRKTQEALAAKGRRKAALSGGGAAGRAYQFALERGGAVSPPKPAGRKVAKRTTRRVSKKPATRVAKKPGG